MRASICMPTRRKSSTFTAKPTTSQKPCSAITRDGSSVRCASRPTMSPTITTAITGEAWRRSAMSDVVNTSTVDARMPVR